MGRNLTTMTHHPRSFTHSAMEIQTDMKKLVTEAGIDVNIVPLTGDDPDKDLAITKANLVRIQDAVDAKTS